MDEWLKLESRRGKDLHDQIFDWGMSMAPNEVCGIWRVQKFLQLQTLFFMENVSDDPTMSYRIDTEDLGKFVENFRLGQQSFYEECTVWHTHPSGLIGPSKGDMDTAKPRIKYYVMTIPTREVVKYERIQ